VQADVPLANYHLGIEEWVFFCLSASMLPMTELRVKTMGLIFAMFYTAQYRSTRSRPAPRPRTSPSVPSRTSSWRPTSDSYSSRASPKKLRDRRDPQLSFHLGLFVHWRKLFATRVRDLDYLHAPATDITLWDPSTDVAPQPSHLPLPDYEEPPLYPDLIAEDELLD